MTLDKYNESLFNLLLKGIKFEYDEETQQYSIMNNETPGVFGLGETKEEAVEEYISDFKNNILNNSKIKRKYGKLIIENFSDEEYKILMKNKNLEKSRNNINKLLEKRGI